MKILVLEEKQMIPLQYSIFMCFWDIHMELNLYENLSPKININCWVVSFSGASYICLRSFIYIDCFRMAKISKISKCMICLTFFWNFSFVEKLFELHCVCQFLLNFYKIYYMYMQLVRPHQLICSSSGIPHQKYWYPKKTNLKNPAPRKKIQNFKEHYFFPDIL